MSRTARSILARSALAAALLAPLAAAGCASVGVKPWQRDLLAKRAMQLDPDPVRSGLDEHIYFSREATTGGAAIGGGGCGCN